jgi:lipopolysaccharide export system permease protein
VERHSILSAPVRSQVADPLPVAAPPFARRRRRWFDIRIPWTIERYVALEILRILCLALLGLSVLYTAAIAYETIRSGMQITYIWPLLAKMVAYPLYFSVPLCLLFGVTLALGRLTADLELAAMRCHGASHLQVYAPVLALGLACTAGSYFLNGWLVPRLHYEKRNLQQYILKQLENLGAGVNRTILLPEGGGSLLVRAYEGTELRGVHIDLHRKLQASFLPAVRSELPARLPEKVTILAREGRLQLPEDRAGVTLHLRGVEVLVPERVAGSGGADSFHQKFEITQTLSIPLSFEPKAPGIKDRIDPELRAHIAELRRELATSPENDGVRRRIWAAESEWHRRLAFSLSSFSFALIGASLCFLSERRSRLVPFFAANAIVLVVFYPLLLVGALLGERGYFPAGAMALSNIVLLGAGIYLLQRVLRR